MSYNEFLFCQLLCVYVEYFRELEYDLLYEESIKLYKIFEESKYNNPKYPEYECIEEYIKAIF